MGASEQVGHLHLQPPGTATSPKAARSSHTSYGSICGFLAYTAMQWAMALRQTKRSAREKWEVASINAWPLASSTIVPLRFNLLGAQIQLIDWFPPF
ncbi:hypothetical protein Zm00014a_027820 [Zea mays]|jgi:hypothetical protein|uniref:Uncharacterized protein n=2 Tax=Zea mays TaxID=4577 RepID=C0P7T9_MAIZE|nr:uncharacterized protein LOC100382442 [Zea mays]ACN29055.1 unknown [Zea mays]AQK98015.1 hypothetical protein ZEAMMB73_Zm00001d011783 [Zea mays]PWZ10912.1 hypothetical protein Zm00014a_027820 [Zea mays]|eukprot:NP_001168655.1 uncharacterized protein LOC100382442 [Zea mays]